MTNGEKAAPSLVGVRSRAPRLVEMLNAIESASGISTLIFGYATPMGASQRVKLSCTVDSTHSETAVLERVTIQRYVPYVPLLYMIKSAEFAWFSLAPGAVKKTLGVLTIGTMSAAWTSSEVPSSKYARAKT